MTHHVKQSSFAGVWQCYSYVRHTNTHTHTHTHTKAHKNQPPHPPSPSHSLAWLPAQLPPTSYHESDTLLSAEAPVKLCDPETFLCKEPIHPTNILQTFFCLLFTTRTNLQGETFRNASCFSTFCACIIPCVNQTGQDLTFIFLKASAWSVLCLRHMATIYQLQKSYKTDFELDIYV